MKKNKKPWKKRLIFILAALLVLAAYAVGASLLLRAEGQEENPTDLRTYNDDSSLILLTGKEYSLEEEQEETFLEQQQLQEEKPQEKEPEVKKAESIVQPQKQDDSQGESVPGKEDGKNGEGEGGNKGEGGNQGEGEGGKEKEDPKGDDDNGGEGGEGGGETDPDLPDMKPVIVSNISEAPYGPNVAFTVQATDYKGYVIDSFYYDVRLNGTKLFSTEKSADGWVTYRANDCPEGTYLVEISVTDPEGHSNQVSCYLTVVAAAEVLTEATVSLEVEARVVGGGVLLSTSEKIYKNESAAHFVKRVLEAYGFAPAMDDGSYLYSIGGIFIGEPNVPDTIKPFVEEYVGELYGVNTEGALGERDFTANSGWIYHLDGYYEDKGLYGVTLEDGNVIHIGFTLWGGAEYNGQWANYGEW